jgi:hypothetical protein
MGCRALALWCRSPEVERTQLGLAQPAVPTSTTARLHRCCDSNTVLHAAMYRAHYAFVRRDFVSISQPLTAEAVLGVRRNQNCTIDVRTHLLNIYATNGVRRGTLGAWRPYKVGARSALHVQEQAPVDMHCDTPNMPPRTSSTLSRLLFSSKQRKASLTLSRMLVS